MSAVVPLKLSERHRYIAWLELGGATNNEIAAALSLTPSWVSTVRSSPLYKALLADMRDRVTDENIEQVKAVIMGEAMNSVRTLIGLRDNGAVESATRRGAANDLLDRTPGLGKVQHIETDETLHVTFAGAELRALMQAVDENEGRPLRAIEGVATVLPNGAERIAPRTIDEFIAEYEGAP